MREKSEKPDEKLEGKIGPVMEVHMDANRTLSQLSYAPISYLLFVPGLHRETLGLPAEPRVRIGPLHISCSAYLHR